MFAYALEKIPQRDSPLLKTWPTGYDLPDKSKAQLLEQHEAKYTRLNESKIPSLPTQDDLPSCDGVPMETERHRLQMNLLIDSLKPWFTQSNQGYVSGNMFVYFSPNQVKDEDFKGPDVFVVRDVGKHVRKSWVVWEEGKPPDIVIELLSESTAKKDKGPKKQIYRDKLKVPEYYWFDPHNPEDFQGFFLKKSKLSKICVYEPIAPDAQNRLVSKSLGLALTHWHGIYEGVTATWLRWETLSGKLLLTSQEIQTQRANTEAKRANAAEQQAQAEAKRANAEKQRAERLAQLLRDQGIDPTNYKY